ncbi:glutathionylspermidine synthase family protein [Bailinhaonella thermotolerans]|uniref:Glutathionylspermidine synthase family protein n=1 Tax=Bailinhaonella thermotolerans TaxID=1070861 RepID=A0A3A4B935_9ACTN|nr:glutathionylspermidine synthase family protein [Bailinhaonella thermotolerans]RJL34194.1 glutathionylspermidine synthase family protein [Bailinhaonella thermotolerans]
MRRYPLEPRDDWEKLVKADGLSYAVQKDGTPYWDESAYYVFAPEEIDYLEAVTAELHDMSVQAARYALDEAPMSAFGLPESARETMAASLDSPSLYGRFDLVWDGEGDAKLLEYNADTPTALIEASVTQWMWLEDRFPAADQWNALHERLVATWAGMPLPGGRVHFAHAEDGVDGEEWVTVAYLRDTAAQAGLLTAGLRVSEIGWDGVARRFIDPAGDPIEACFKLYPWEDMFAEPYGELAGVGGTMWLEPPWKALLSNKALLAVLWGLFPGHPNLLPAYLDGPRDMTEYARKALHGREGDGVTVVTAGGTEAHAGEYGAEGYCWQRYVEVPSLLPGRRFILGAWMAGDRPAGLGVREYAGLVTTDRAWFVPHVIG